MQYASPELRGTLLAMHVSSVFRSIFGPLEKTGFVTGAPQQIVVRHP